MRAPDVARRSLLAATFVLLPFLASSYGTLHWYAFAAVRKAYTLISWHGPLGAAVAPSSYFVFSVVCAFVATVELVASGERVLRARDSSRLQGPYTVLRALYLLHGAAAPFLALYATQHLSPTGRGRAILARYLETVLEYQALITFAVASVAIALTLAISKPERARGKRAEALRSVRGMPALIAAWLVSGVASRGLAQTFAEAANGGSVASILEREVVLAVGVIVVTIAAVTLLVKPLAAPVDPDDDEPRLRLSLGYVARSAATLLLPWFALTIACWASSRPCDPGAVELDRTPTVPREVTRPFPLARSEEEANGAEGAWVVDGSKRLREVWPRGIGTREVHLVVQRDSFDRGKSGVFARFDTGRLGVLRLTVRERDGAPPTCPIVPGRRCVEATSDVTPDRIALLRAGSESPSIAYLASPDATVAELARDVTLLTKTVYETSKTTPLDMDVDLVVGLAGPAVREAPKPATKHPVLPPRAQMPAPTPTGDDRTAVAPSPGCATPHPETTFEAHDQVVDGVTRNFFVSVLPPSAGPRALIVVLHGNGSTAEEMRRALPMEPLLQGRAVILYLEARARYWDNDTPPATNADVAFVKAAVTWAEATFCTDEHRRFVTGFSGGGYLANALACAGEFRAVVAHSAGGPAPSEDEPDLTSGLFRCAPSSALVFHGTEDGNVRLAEGLRSAERWRVTNRCAPSRAVEGGGGPCELFAGCEGRVGLCVVPGLGHAVAPEAAARTVTFFDGVR